MNKLEKSAHDRKVCDPWKCPHEEHALPQAFTIHKKYTRIEGGNDKRYPQAHESVAYREWFTLRAIIDGKMERQPFRVTRLAPDMRAERLRAQRLGWKLCYFDDPYFIEHLDNIGKHNEEWKPLKVCEAWAGAHHEATLCFKRSISDDARKAFVKVSR